MGNRQGKTLGSALEEARGDAQRWNAWVRYAVYEMPGLFCPEYNAADSEVSYTEGSGGFQGTMRVTRPGAARSILFANVTAGSEAAPDVVERVTRAIAAGERVLVVTSEQEVPDEWKACVGGWVRAITFQELAPLLARPVTRPGLG